MSRQHALPVLVPAQGQAIPLRPLGLGQDGHGWSEAEVQALVQAHPACLPIGEIDPLFAGPVPICTELNTTAGPIDNFMVTPSGLPVLVECKLWRNPQARREVVGQILDYAKELSRWTASDLQREASRRLDRRGNALLDLVRAAGHEVDEIAFNDALTLNLRRGRFLLLIVGDGIREGVEAIAEYVQAHAGLHFTLGLVELPIFAMPDGGRLVAPRVLARTVNVTRTVVDAPAGLIVLDEAEQDEEVEPVSTERQAQRQAGRDRRRSERLSFWSEFLSGLKLDDPEQIMPRPSMAGQLYFKFPSPGGSSWLTVYRSPSSGQVGLFLAGNVDSPGQMAARALDGEAGRIRQELDSGAIVEFGEDWPKITDALHVKNFTDSDETASAITWLRRRTNDFINVLRPRLRAALTDLGY